MVYLCRKQAWSFKCEELSFVRYLHTIQLLNRNTVLCLSHYVRLLTQRRFTLKIAHHSANFNNMKFSNSSSYHEILIQCL